MTTITIRHWCPVLRDTAEVIIEGEVKGDMIDGVIQVCLEYSTGVCREIFSSFCLVGREIYTKI